MALLITTYLRDIQSAVELINTDGIEAIVARLFQAFLDGSTIYTMGNGASAALASHMACDLGKGTATDLARGPDTIAAPRLRIMSLNDNTALMTAYSNDLSYQDVFVEQLKNFLQLGDVVIGVSGSGGSPNVLRAMAFARGNGATTIGLTGSQASAYKLLELSDLFVQATPRQMEQIEDLHVIIHHVIGLSLRERIATHLRTGVVTSSAAPFLPEASEAVAQSSD